MHIKISHIKYTDKTKSIMMYICKIHSFVSMRHQKQRIHKVVISYKKYT